MQDFPERLTALEPFWGLWWLDAFINEGRYGKVYRIKREEFGETYYAALKWISLPQNQSEIQSLRNEGYDDASIADHYASVIKAFQSEIVLMSKLRGHSHIVSFEDHLFEKRENELGWDILIRMELLESLPGFFRKERAVRDVVTLGCDICDALTLCAKYKIVHRDIKPDNIFVNENGDFKLGDFGVARQMEHTQTNMSRKGTPFFMAPEVYMGREADARADQYSLGLVMHRLLNAQQIPFAPAFDRILTHQEREEALLQRLRGEALPPPLQGSEKLKQIILKASNYQPKKRFAAPEEMKAALQQTLNERENQAALFKAASGQISSKRSSLKPDVAPGRGRKPNKKKKDKTGWVLGILTGLILLLAGAGVWLLIQAPDEGVPASFENTIPAVQTPVPSTARTPMPTATPVPIDPIETLTAVLTSAPTTAPTVTLTATPTDTPTIVPTFTPTPTATPTSAPTVTPTPAPTPAEESLASEYTYHFDGLRYSTNHFYKLLWRITVNPYEIAEEIPAIYQLIRGEDAAWLSPDYSYDWQLSAEAAEVFGSSVQKDYLNTVLKDHVYIVVMPEKEKAALGLIGKQVLTLTISRKSDDTVMTKVNCVLDSFARETRVIAFTPGKPVTITLPQDEIASTYDDAKVIYEWWRLPVDSVPIYMTEWAGLTSYTFTPEADWDGDTVYTVVYREGMRGDGYTSTVYILKSDGTSSAQPAPTTQPEASGVSVSDEGNFEYRIDEAGNAVITKYTGIETICNVPETLDGRTVVSIEGNRSKSVFEDCANLQYVLLPDTIQSIGQFAFSKCDSLTGVSLPESLISIGFCAFKDCVSLQDLVFPDAVAFIGSSAFRGCLSLQHVILPKGIKEIAESAFADCANLVSVTCQDSLTIIGYKAFDGCTSLKNLTLSKNLEEIGWAAFRDCRQLNSLGLPDRLSTIEYAAFDGCQNLKYLYVPDSVEKIGVGADGTLAFDGETTLICPEGSYAETYAQMYFLTHATVGTTEGPLEYYTVLTSKRTYLYPRMDEESEAMLRIPGQMLISAVPAGDGWLKTEYAGIPGYVTTNNLKAYDLDKEYTWKEFQTMVNNALKACENGEVLVPGPKHVAAYKNGDKAITMPDGVKLIIEGGSFESMLVTNGSIELRGVTVNCARDERCAITVSIPSKERSLELLIDENTTIAATGHFASAIGTDYNTPHVKNAILNYRIVNNGRIESDGGSGIEINNWIRGGNGEAQVYIENNGMILSHWWGGIRCILCDQQELEIINRGSIESIDHSGIEIESGSFHITNESGAVIKGGSSTGAIWVDRSYADATISTISGSISNAGELQNLVVYTYVDFLPMIVYEGNDLEVSVRLTQIVRDKDEILTMEQTKEIAKELLRNIKNGSGYAFESAIIELLTESELDFTVARGYTVALESNEM